MNKEVKKTVYTICALMLLIGIFNLPITYYTLLRGVVFAGGIVILFDNEKNMIPKLIFVLIIILYNPVVPVYLGKKPLWIPLDIISAGFFLVQGFYKKQEGGGNKTNKDNKKEYKRDRIY